MSSKNLLGEYQEKIRSYLVSPNEILILGMPDYLRLLIIYQLQMNRHENLCENCSKCCEEAPFVGLTPCDVERIAQHLNCSQSDFISKYCVKHSEHPSTLYRFRTIPCVFLENNRCKIYQARPNSCIFFPFITELRQETWDLYEEKNIATITIPICCVTAMKIKELREGKT